MKQEQDRRGFLRCMAWAGTGVVWTMAGGLASSYAPNLAEATPRQPSSGARPLTFVQVSDSHIGFAKDPNPDARATFRESVALIRAMPTPPAFIIHTGDVTHLSKPEEFDDADKILAESGIPAFHVPGEHDVLDEGQGQAFLDRYGKDTKGDGWFSFDHSGVHFIGLVNVKQLRGGGMGYLGPQQLAWLKSDLADRSSSQPIVVFAHIPLWTIFPDWGWGTDDSVQALALLKPFGSVTVLNGHVHQVLQKVEGNVAFHTARSTAFPQPAPGAAPSPGPLKVPADALRATLGVRTVHVVPGASPVALVDTPLT